MRKACVAAAVTTCRSDPARYFRPRSFSIVSPLTTSHCCWPRPRPPSFRSIDPQDDGSLGSDCCRKQVSEQKQRRAENLRDTRWKSPGLVGIGLGVLPLHGPRCSPRFEFLLDASLLLDAVPSGCTSRRRRSFRGRPTPVAKIFGGFSSTGYIYIYIYISLCFRIRSYSAQEAESCISKRR